MTIVRQEVMHDKNRNNIGMNNNLVNAQSDGDLWPSKFNKYFTGSFFTKGRWFLAFDTWQHSIDLMLEQVKTRGMYIGGYAPVYAKTYIDSVDTFVNSYYKEWVRGETNPTVPIDNDTFKGIKSIYNQEYKYFSQSIQKKNQQLQELLSSAIDNSRYNIRFFLLGK